MDSSVSQNAGNDGKADGDCQDKQKDRYPEEYEKYYAAYASVATDAELSERRYLINPMNFIGTSEESVQAKHFRIRVGGQDADTATTISMALALKLENCSDSTVNYAIVWDQPHCDADYPGEICDWIAGICK